MKKIDLHTHTTASDGVFTPGELIDHAKKSGLIALAVTDHDTIDGIPEAMYYSEKAGLILIQGIEFSVEYDKGSFHLVGLYIDYRNKKLQSEIERLTILRANRAHMIVEDLKGNGVDIPFEDVEKEGSGSSIGRPHIARVMVRHGYFDSVNEVFNNYLVKGKPGYIKKERISIDAAISLIREAGGIPIIAHPISLNFRNFNEFDEILSGFVKKGIEGIEVFSSMHTLDEVKDFYRIAEKHNLVISGGSDYHGDNNEVIGNYTEDTAIPVEIYYKLDEYMKKSG